jgi:hypothetical protein
LVKAREHIPFVGAGLLRDCGHGSHVYAARFGAHGRRQGKNMLAQTDVLRRTATFQAAYFLVTGLSPIVSRPTFEAVTGPETDYWLVRTVGALASVIGTTLGVAAYRNRVSSELAVLGIGSALAFGAVDIFYVTTGRISRVYLADAAVECLIAAGWASATPTSVTARRLETAVPARCDCHKRHGQG